MSADCTLPQSALNSPSFEELRALLETVYRQQDTIIGNQNALERNLSELKTLLTGHPSDPSLGMVLRMRAFDDFMAKQQARNLIQDTTLRNIRWLWTATGVTSAGIITAIVYIINHFLDTNTH